MISKSCICVFFCFFFAILRHCARGLYYIERTNETRSPVIAFSFRCQTAAFTLSLSISIVYMWTAGFYTLYISINIVESMKVTVFIKKQTKGSKCKWFSPLHPPRPLLDSVPFIWLLAQNCSAAMFLRQNTTPVPSTMGPRGLWGTFLLHNRSLLNDKLH